MTNKLKLLTCLASYSLLISCNTVRPYDLNPEKVQRADHVKAFAVGKIGNDFLVARQGRFRTALIETSKSPLNGTAALKYLKAGVAVSDLYCRAYFEKLGEDRADNEALRGSFNVADAATAAALGLSGASSGVIAGTSIGFSTIESLFETLDSAYLVSAEVDQVEALVFSSRDTLYQTLFSGTGPGSYYDAERQLAAYHHLCTFNGVKRLVNEAVTNGRPELETNTNSERNKLNLLAASADIDSLSELLLGPNAILSREQMASLYAYYHVARSDDGPVYSVLKTVLSEMLGTDADTDTDTWNQKLKQNEKLAKSFLSDIDRRINISAPANSWVISVRARAAELEKSQEEVASGNDDNVKEQALETIQFLTNDLAQTSDTVQALSKEQLYEKMVIPEPIFIQETSKTLTVRIK